MRTSGAIAATARGCIATEWSPTRKRARSRLAVGVAPDAEETGRFDRECGRSSASPDAFVADLEPGGIRVGAGLSPV